ncbi:MAG: rhodanese-like domain-containing protein [Prosthecochloris sp.]|uniref:Rhodanese domain protein n=1 Tax=Prosthecochloris aestuarii (strain DSM 271 / SK 413) TaxID=290512 RepID=B4S4L7_PROA2|nr:MULTISPECIES: rhodanese-like domain-containing protein [Prosthecochloris]ACF46913.1 Rhodanese domain protein [Prosthecochloris aestuarii DSM 271]MCW8797426.1 rhodanese-like domain-containing protein [Prosthecochloris sp.]RDD29552.1 rhodanese-like domain-containing protein [Prosthecochloris sp. ZM]
MLENFFKPPDPLAFTERMVEHSFSVPNISTAELETLIAQKAPIVLFDVRQQEEYDTSHIQGAIHLDPRISKDDFIAAHKKKCQEKHLVFYCSVGHRSSEMIAKLDECRKQTEASACSNLKGGIFRWYNEGRPVVTGNGVTDAIHEYNALWAMMIKKRKP